MGPNPNPQRSAALGQSFALFVLGLRSPTANPLVHIVSMCATVCAWELVSSMASHLQVEIDLGRGRTKRELTPRKQLGFCKSIGIECWCFNCLLSVLQP